MSQQLPVELGQAPLPFNPSLGFLRTAINEIHVSELHQTPVLSIPGWVFLVLQSQLDDGDRPARPLSIPGWVFLVLQWLDRSRRDGNLALSIPQWVFSVSQRTSRTLVTTKFSDFQSLTGFFGSATHHNLCGCNPLIHLSIPDWVLSVLQRIVRSEVEDDGQLFQSLSGFSQYCNHQLGFDGLGGQLLSIPH